MLFAGSIAAEGSGRSSSVRFLCVLPHLSLLSGLEKAPETLLTWLCVCRVQEDTKILGVAAKRNKTKQTNKMLSGSFHLGPKPQTLRASRNAVNIPASLGGEGHAPAACSASLAV